RAFGYVSSLLDPYTRFTMVAGASYGRFQIPNTPGLTPNFTAFGVSSFNSALLNENQLEQNYYGANARSMAQTSNSPTSRATAVFISFPTPLVTSSSTA